jgi:hypothetical protein
MNMTDLSRLSSHELRAVSKRNFIIFVVLTPIDLGFFYHSLFREDWVSMFLALGLFIASLAIYDNYKIAKMLYEASRSTA